MVEQLDRAGKPSAWFCCCGERGYLRRVALPITRPTQKSNSPNDATPAPRRLPGKPDPGFMPKTKIQGKKKDFVLVFSLVFFNVRHSGNLFG